MINKFESWKIIQIFFFIVSNYARTHVTLNYECLRGTPPSFLNMTENFNVKEFINAYQMKKFEIALN